MSIDDQVKRLAERYRKYGIEEQDILDAIQSGRAKGFDDEVALTGVRLALAHEFGEHEYFSSAEIAKALGMTVDEVTSTIEEHKAELLQHGDLVSVSPELLHMMVGGRE